MNLADLNDVPLATQHAFARDAYDNAATLFLGYYGDPIGPLDRAIEAHPDFLMGYAAKAGILLSSTDIRFYPLVEETLIAAELQYDPKNVRANIHLAAARAWFNGDWRRACELYGDVLAIYPRDTLALQIAHLGDFYLGRADVLRDRPSATLEHWNTSQPGYSYALGMHAFGLEECGDFDAAEARGHEALQLNPRDPWAIHAVAHVYEMKGQLKQGIDWLEDRRSEWLPDNAFSFHNAWHLALYWLELEQYQKVLSLYDELVRPSDSDIVLELIDASALLWRLHLRGIDVGNRWQTLLAQWNSRAGERFYVFNDIHALVTLLASGRLETARRLVADINTGGAGKNGYNPPAWKAGQLVTQGLMAFAEQRYAEALPDLISGHRQSAAFGGSHAQRDLIALTALRCAELAGNAEVSAALLQQRIASRPNSPFVWSSLADWRSRHDSQVTAANARRQSTHAKNEWLRLLQERKSSAA